MIKINLNSMSNDELHSILKKSNLAVGPVTDTTRKLYEKKIIKYLDENNLTLEDMYDSSLSEEKIKNLSNDDLFNLLRERGFAPGPVISSTRSLYEKRLINSLNDPSFSSSAASSSLSSSSPSSMAGTSFNQSSSRLADLSDKELFDLLKSYGLNPGPITPATRNLYENKLNKHLNNNSATAAQTTQTIKTNSILKRRSFENTNQSQTVVDPAKLSDKELFDLLKANGLNPGPVNRSTRSLYEKKLINYFNTNLTSLPSLSSSSLTSFSLTDNSTQDPEPMAFETSDQQAPTSTSYSIFPNLKSLVYPSTYTSFFSSTPEHQQSQPANLNKSRRSIDKLKSVRFEDDVLNDENNNDIFVIKDTKNKDEQNVIDTTPPASDEPQTSLSQNTSNSGGGYFSFSRNLFPSREYTKSNYLDKYAENLQNISNRRSLHEDRFLTKTSYFNKPLIRTGQHQQQQQTRYVQPLHHQQQFKSYYGSQLTNRSTSGSIYSQQPDVPYQPIIIQPKPTIKHYILSILAFIGAFLRKSFATNRFIVVFLVVTILIYLFLNSIPSNNQNPIIDY